MARIKIFNDSWSTSIIKVTNWNVTIRVLDFVLNIRRLNFKFFKTFNRILLSRNIININILSRNNLITLLNTLFINVTFDLNLLILLEYIHNLSLIFWIIWRSSALWLLTYSTLFFSFLMSISWYNISHHIIFTLRVYQPLYIT
jgi:hypothetical protein